MSLGHAAIGQISSLARTVQCPGSVALCAQYPQKPTEQTREGDVADWTAQQYQLRKIVLERTRPLSQLHPVVDDEMIRGAILWRTTLEKYGGALSMPQIPVACAPIHPQSFGSPDANWMTSDGVLTNADYKYGHVIVSAVGHWQSVGYLAGKAHMLDLLGKPDVPCRAIIVQPRDYHQQVKVWDLTIGELRAYINVAAAAVAESLQPNAPTRVGPECLYCPARHACRTLQAAARGVVEFSGLAEPAELTPQQIGFELSTAKAAAEILKARITGLETQIEAMWFSGMHTPGWKCEQSRGNLWWNRDIGEVTAAAMAQHQVDIRKSPHAEVITPRQAIDRGLPESFVNAYASREAGGWKVVKDDGSEVHKRFKQ